MITLFGITHETFVALHDYFLPRTIITSHKFIREAGLYDITLTDNAIYKINLNALHIDLGGKKYTVDEADFMSFLYE